MFPFLTPLVIWRVGVFCLTCCSALFITPQEHQFHCTAHIDRELGSHIVFNYLRRLVSVSSVLCSVISTRVICLCLSLAVLTDGLQASDISSKDDLHHQICHQSHESKNGFGISFYVSNIYSGSGFWISKILPQIVLPWRSTSQISPACFFPSCTSMWSRLWRNLSERSVGSFFLITYCTLATWSVQIPSNLDYNSNSSLISSFQCKPEYKVAGLYVVDSIVRQSRHQFGADKDVFGPRFTKNITETFENLCLCPVEDRVGGWACRRAEY